MAKALLGPGKGLVLAILAGAVTLAGCSPAPLVERLPTELGGLPSGTPAAPRTPYRFPAVHDTPPPRTTAPLTAEQQIELEELLQKARQKQEGHAADLKDTSGGTAKKGAK